MKSIYRIALCIMAACLLCAAALAADGETLYNAEYCFSEADFQPDRYNDLTGIFVTGVPDAQTAAVHLGSRIIRAGDVLPLEELGALRLTPATADSCNAVLCYPPICGTPLGERTQLTIRIQSGKNETPTAVAAELETYKNIPNDGTLQGKDPEDAALTFQLTEKPKRGTVQLNSDGTYVYTPDKNKVGEDSFSFTVTDDAGNVSQPAVVKIRILKPSDCMTFSDMDGSPDRFEAMWLCGSGMTSGRTVAGQPCFCPNEPVSRSDFLIMAMGLAGIAPEEELSVSGFLDAETMPVWKQSYLAAAMRRGLIRGEVTEEGLCFRPDDAITPTEAAVLLQALLRLPVPAAATASDIPAWASGAVSALQEAGISLESSSPTLTRLQAARLFYKLYRD